jgi:hypothetical protein
MSPDSASDLMITVAFLLLTGAGATLAGVVSRLRLPRSERRKRRRQSEMSAVFRAVALWYERSETPTRKRSRRSRRTAAIEAGAASSGAAR